MSRMWCRKDPRMILTSGGVEYVVQVDTAVFTEEANLTTMLTQPTKIIFWKDGEDTLIRDPNDEELDPAGRPYDITILTNNNLAPGTFEARCRFIGLTDPDTGKLAPTLMMCDPLEPSAAPSVTVTGEVSRWTEVAEVAP